MIRKCPECGSYTMEQEHCEKEAESSRPPKFSFPDRHGEYRRKTKRQS